MLLQRGMEFERPVTYILDMSPTGLFKSREKGVKKKFMMEKTETRESQETGAAVKSGVLVVLLPLWQLCDLSEIEGFLSYTST